MSKNRVKKIKAKTYISFIVVITLLSLISSCDFTENKKHINTNHIHLEVKVSRFEQDLFNMSVNKIYTEIQELEKQYPNFYPLYVENILGFKQPNDTSNKYVKEIEAFLKNEAIQGLYDSTQAKYNDFGEIENELEQAFKHVKYYYPDVKVPQIITFLSEFGYGIVTYDSVLAIGLDLFLGEKYKYYPSMFPAYMIRKLNREHLVSYTMLNYLQKYFEFDDKNKKLIDWVVYKGKMVFMLDYILPNKPDSVKLGYTKQQIDWCQQNEQDIWTFFLKNELLYTSDRIEIGRYTREGPTTSGMPKNAPGNISNWLGWKIVKKFMEENDQVTLQELMEIEDGQQILMRSKYKPKR